MTTEICQGKQVKEKLLQGVKKLTQAVKVTLGPKGLNVIIEQGGLPLITNDGYTIAKSIQLQDGFEALGAKTVFEASAKTNELAGDGTTTACVLAEALIEEGLKNTTFGVNPIELGKGMKKACDIVVNELETMSRKIKNNDDIKHIATISCQDEEIGQLIAKAFEMVGNDGIITLEESNSLYTTLDITDGIKFDKGYVSTYFCTNMESQVCELENTYILVTSEKIDNINQILSILEQIAQNGHKLLIVATDYSEEVIAALVMNKLRGSINVAAVKSFAFGAQKQEILEDFCISVGANLISLEKNIELENAKIEDLGKAKKAIITRDSTTILNGDCDKKAIETRINAIKERKKQCDNDFETKVYSERLARLQNCAGVIKVGGATDVEISEKKLRIEDALSATKSAIEEGIVIGGGSAFIKCAKVLEEQLSFMPNEEQIGAKIVLKAIEAPLRQIAKNACIDDGVVINEIKNNSQKDYGYDALKNTYCNLEEKGIIDPKKVTRCALQNAVSVATSLLTTECAIINKIEKN